MKKTAFIFIVFGIIPFILKSQPFFGGNGSISDPYQISTKAELLQVTNYADKAFILLNDIDFNGDGPYTTSIIANFSGKFDGLGYRILNLTLEGSISFFGTITETGSVKNLHIRNLNFTDYFYSNGSTNTRNQYHAPFVYTNNGEIENCSYEGNVTAYVNLAGFALINNGTIKNCYSNAIVNAYDGMNISNNWFPGKYGAGFVQTNNVSGIIINCYSAGTVTVGDFGAGGFVHTNAGQISNSFAFNTSVSSTWYGYAVHRFANSSSGTLSGVYALETMTLNGSTTTSSDAGSIEGADISSADITVQTTYTGLGWDFSRNWQLEAGDTYPQLRVLPDCPEITLTEIISSACENSAYNESIGASGGDGTYEFTLSAGTLPSGLSLSTAGLLSGTLTTPETISFTVSATDENGCVGTKDYLFTVFPTKSSLVSESICFGSNFILGTQTLTQSGTYTETFQTTNGCDSVVTLTLTVNPVYNSQLPSADNLIAYYPFNGNANDESGNGHDGTVYGATLTEDRNGNANSAYLFDGSDGIDIPHSDELNMDGALSVSCWIKLTELQSAMIFGKSNYWNATNYLMRVQSDGNIQWEYNGYLNTTTSPLQANNWYHIVVTANNPGEQRKVYVNGQLIAETTSSSGPFGSVAERLTLGYSSLNGERFRGAIDEVRFYNKDLTGVEITSLYQESSLAEKAEICEGDSYSFGGTDYTVAGEYEHTFSSIHGCDSTVTLILTVNPVYNHTDVASICEGESFVFGKQTLTTAGEYEETFTSVLGCDSIVTLTLTVNPVYNDTDEVSICDGGFYMFGTDLLTTAGEYEKTFASISGCDSTVILTLSVHSNYELPAPEDHVAYYPFDGDANDESGNGLNGTVNGATLTDDRNGNPGSAYFFNGYTGQNGIDVEHSDELYMDGPFSISLWLKPEIAQDALILGKSNFTLTTNYWVRLSSDGNIFWDYNGIQATTTSPLQPNNWYHIVLTANNPGGEKNIFINGQLISGTNLSPSNMSFGNVTTGLTIGYASYYSDYFKGSIDEIRIFDKELTENEIAVLYEESLLVENAEICEGESFSFGGTDYTEAGEYEHTFTTINGCDSTVTLILTVNPVYNHTDEASICQGESFAFGTQTLTTAGEYEETFTSVLGCDSTVTMTLTVNPVYNHTDVAGICEGESFVFGKQTLTTAGEYEGTFTSVFGCDSIVTLTLTVNPVYNHTDVAGICDGESFAFGTQILTTAGEYEETFTSVIGCDSIVTLTLIVNPVYNHTDVATICEGESFVFGKQTLTTSGEYTEVFESVNGCDSTVVLTLTVFPVYNVLETVTVYEDELPYQFGKQSLTAGGEFIGNFYSVTGCDSIVTLTLIVKPEDNIPPDVVCNPIEVSLNLSGQYVLDEADISTILEGTTDNDSEYDELLIEVSPGLFSCEHAGTETPVLFTVTDKRGNVNTCSTTVNVIDQTRPQISCKNISINLDENGEANLSKNEFYTSAFDACGIANITVSRQQFNCSHLGTNDVIVRATDNNNNSRTCTSVVTVTDNLPPVFEPLADQIAEADAGECFAKIDYPEIIVSDNCSVEELYLIEGLGPDAEFPVGNSRERWVALDDSGNSDTLSFEVIVSANYTEPSLNAISDIVVSEGTETVSVQMSGIFDGSLCENFPLEFEMDFTNNRLVESFSVDYVPGEDTGELLLVLTENSIGESLITLILRNTQTNKEFSTGFSLVVSAVNHPPFLAEAPENMEMKAGDTLIVLLSSEKGVIFDDTDENDSLYFSLAMEDGSDVPEWMRFMNDSLLAHPSILDTGCYKLLLVAADLNGGEAYCPLTLCVSIPSHIKYMSDFEIKVYPNPTSGIVYVDFLKYTGQRTEISVTDILGKEILRKIYSAEERIEVDLSDRATGIYFMKVQSNRLETNHKIIIKRNP